MMNLEPRSNIDTLSQTLSTLVADILNLVTKIDDINCGFHIDINNDDLISMYPILKTVNMEIKNVSMDTNWRGMNIYCGNFVLNINLTLRKNKFGLFGKNILHNLTCWQDKRSNMFYGYNKQPNYKATVGEYQALIDKLTNIKSDLEIELNTLRGDVHET